MKKFLISIVTLVLMISMMTTIYAAQGSITISASSNQVVKGGTFTVTVAGSADENITALQAALSFDTTKLSLESKTPGTGFTDASGSNSEIAILSTDNTNLSKTGTLYTLTFKVLDTATVGETTINVTNATLALVNASQTQENVSVADGSVTVTIKEDNTTIGDNDNNNQNTTGNTATTPSTNSNSTSNSSSNSASKSNNSTSKKTTLPQTGVEVVSIIAIAILSVFAVISYVSYKKYRNI